MNKKDNQDEIGIDNRKELIANNSKYKEGQPLPPKSMKKPVPKHLDFSFLQSTFDAIKGKANNMPPTLGEQQSIPPEQPGSSKMNKNQGPQGEASSAALNVTDSAKKDSTDGLQRKLDAIHKRNITVQSTSLTPERIQQRQEEVLLPSSECEPQPEGDMMDEDGSELGKGRLVVRATTIDDFLKEHGIDVDLDGIGIGEQTTELHDDTEDSGALDQNYYQYVMAESDDEEGHTKKKKTCGHTSYVDIYGRTKEQREEVTFELGGPVGPTPKSVSNLTSFAGTIDQVHPPSQCREMGDPNNSGCLEERNLKGTSEEPQRFEVFIVTRTNRKRKELDEGTQTAISRQASGETEEEAFQSIFGKEQPGRDRCYGRSVTQTDLQRHAEISALKQQHQDEVTTLRNELGDMKTQQQQQ
ncbi:hypothetical protein PIB30_090458 [Stylosanthes scabra]|uniref:Uncharacterized protein n=1 Tax=Stylosanthes scabra TaxID=79078 RepID=A0ABU6SUN3_9FABA|nr:hypothetical protein [Stylosanthes scabra]